MVKSNNYIIDMKTGFYNRRFFNLRLREEQRRTERSGSSFSVLALDISGLAGLIQKRPELKVHQMKKVITNVIQENTRDIDIKNWHGDTTLKILMPETPTSGATTLAEKLQEKVNDAFGIFFGLTGVFDLKRDMRITSYPDEALGDPGKPAKPKTPPRKKSMAEPVIKWADKGTRPQKKKRGRSR
jgi:GGDEF domain-containing protein